MTGPRKEGQPEHFEIPAGFPEITQVQDFARLEQRIRNISLLNESIKGLRPYRSSQIALEEVNIDSLHPCALYVLDQNLRTQRALRNSFLSAHGVDTLRMSEEETMISFRWGGREQEIIPPIVEISEDDGYLPVITDGLHRITLARELGLKKVAVVTISNTAVPLSVLPVEWFQVSRVDTVPPTHQKRKLRFLPPEEAFRWFGLNNRNLERFVGGFSDFSDFSYKVFFRNLDFTPPQEVLTPEPSIPELRWIYNTPQKNYVKTPEQCFREYSSAGVVIMSPDGRHVLLGSHHEAPNLWGNFAGARESYENNSRQTAARELEEEVGIKVKPENLKGPLIVILNDRMKVKIGIIWQITIDKDTEFNIPKESEIKELRWFSSGEAMELMDEGRPDERLWGGIYTAEALKVFTNMAYGQRGTFLGLHQINAWFCGDTQFYRQKSGQQKDIPAVV